MNAAVVNAFGREVLYLPEAGGHATVRAVFQAVREAEDASPGVYAVLFVRLADLAAAPVRGDEVEIGGIRYKVFDIEADAEGASVLRLRQVN
ncbi:MAG: hypothetical protein IT167_30865 [Bryobacterales bacterium]|nr:hypothetical protein [Bryobacterales bacterium]